MPTSWRMHPTDISTADTMVIRTREPKKKPEPKPKPGRSAEKENGMAAPAARKDPTAPIRNSERLGVPRGRGWGGGAGIPHPGTIGGKAFPPYGGYGIPPGDCLLPAEPGTGLNRSEAGRELPPGGGVEGRYDNPFPLPGRGRAAGF